MSEWSIANNSNSIQVPDFSRGVWKTNNRLERTLNGGGTTGVSALAKADASKLLNVK